MADPATKRMSIAEFFAWQEQQPVRYELVDGQPLRMMAGARNVHDLIVVNVLADLRGQLRGGPCRPFTGDGGVETTPGQIRRPDIGVDCGRWNPDAMTASAPRLVAEVLSPTTRDFDTFAKLAEYKTIESLTWILLIEPNAPHVTAWSRGEDRGWAQSVYEGLDGRVDLPFLNAALLLSSIYEGVTFPILPRLVADTAVKSDRPPVARN